MSGLLQIFGRQKIHRQGGPADGLRGRESRWLTVADGSVEFRDFDDPSPVIRIFHFLLVGHFVVFGCGLAGGPIGAAGQQCGAGGKDEARGNCCESG